MSKFRAVKVKSIPFTLRTVKEEKAYQESLGGFKRFYYGINMYECCGCYPRFCVDKDFDCYFICEVCGNSTDKYTMPWMAKNDWQSKHRPFVQMTIDDIFKEG